MNMNDDTTKSLEQRAMDAMYAAGITNYRYINTGGGCMVIQLPHPSIEDGHVWITDDSYDIEDVDAGLIDPEWVIGIYSSEEQQEADEYRYIEGGTDVLIAALNTLYTEGI